MSQRKKTPTKREARRPSIITGASDPAAFDVPGTKQSDDPRLQRGLRLANAILPVWGAMLADLGYGANLSGYMMLLHVTADGGIVVPVGLEWKGDSCLGEGPEYVFTAGPLSEMIDSLHGSAAAAPVVRRVQSILSREPTPKDMMCGPIVVIMSALGFRSLRLVVANMGKGGTA